MYLIFKRNIFTGQVTEHPALCVDGTPPAEALGRNLRFLWSEGGSRVWDLWVPVVADVSRPNTRLTGGGTAVELWAGWRDTGPVEAVIETCPGVPDPQTTLRDVARALAGRSFVKLVDHPQADAYMGAGAQAIIWEDAETGELTIIDLEDGELTVHVYRGEVGWRLPLDGSSPVHLHGELDADDPLVRFQGEVR